MLLLKALALVFVGYAFAQTTPPPGINVLQDRDCPCSLGTLWTDVAAVIDESTGMGMNGLIQVLSDFGSVYLQSNISPNPGQYSKVGVVTYDKTAKVNFNMSYFTSTQQFEQDIWNIIPNQITEQQSIIKTGIQSGSSLLQSVKKSNRKQALLIYASDYQADGENDPTELVSALKNDGIFIIVVSFNQGGQAAVLKGLQDLASPGMFFQNTDQDLVGEIQKALCQVNCYCPNTWNQYGNTYKNPTHRFGECVKFGEIASAWTPARYACQAMVPGAYLTSASTQSKVDYLKSMAQADTTFNKPHEFLVGLQYTSGAWFWQQGAVNPAVQANAASLPWLSGYPDSSISTNSCGQLGPAEVSETSPFGLKNVNCNTVAKRYVCQVNSCDTDNYCS